MLFLITVASAGCFALGTVAGFCIAALGQAGSMEASDYFPTES